MIARCRVLWSRALTPTTHAVRFERPEGFDFRPVQFCGLELDTDEGGIEYSMSLASSPTRPHLEFAARITSGSPWKRAFAALKPGDVAEIDGAYGHFVLDETHDAILVAGGIGITPLKGMFEYATDNKLPIRVRLLYGNRSEEEIAYRDEIDALASQNPNASVVHTLSRPAASWRGRAGRIGGALIAESAKDLRDPRYYVCGLPSMVHELVQTLVDTGIPIERIKWE